MVTTGKVSGKIRPFTVPQNAIEALKRLRESYNGPVARETLTEADQAVLVAVRIALRRIKKAQQLA